VYDSSVLGESEDTAKGRHYLSGDGPLSVVKAGRELVTPLLDGQGECRVTVREGARDPCAAVQDWDALEALWRGAATALRVDPASAPFIFTEQPLLPGPQRERMMELAFEGLRVPAAYFLRSPVAAAFSAGLSTATVVDMGYEHTRVSCVVEGYLLQRTVQQSPAGQRALDLLSVALARDACKGSLESGIASQARVEGHPGLTGAVPEAAQDEFDQGEIAPRYTLCGSSSSSSSSSGSCSRTMHAYQLSQVGREIKEALARVSPVPYAPELVEVEEEDWVLPDGTRFVVGAPRVMLGETLFVPEIAKRLASGGMEGVLSRIVQEDGWKHGPKGVQAWKNAGGEAPGSAAEGDPAAVDPVHEALNGRDPAAVYRFGSRMRVLLRPSSATGSVLDTVPGPMALQHLVSTALLSADPEHRKALSGAVMLSGGGSLLSGLADRLQTELTSTVSSAFRPKVVYGVPIERQFASWIGSSIMASLGTFQQLWVSKQEYEDEGPGVIDRCCG
jgi:actin-related protein 4